MLSLIDLDNLSQFDLMMTDTGHRDINKDKLTNYLNGITDPINKKFIELIIKYTQYITFDKFYEELLKSIKILENMKFNIYFNLNGKIGSEHWLTLLVWKLIKNNCVNIISNWKDINNDLPIILIDDACYSGHNICARIDEIYYDYELNTKQKLSNEFIICVPYVSICGKCCIEEFCKEFQIKIKFGNQVGSFIHNYHIIPEIKEFLIKSNIDAYDWGNRVFKIENFACPLYFDHKVANNFASFPQIYIDGYNPMTNQNYGPLSRSFCAIAQKEPT